MYPEFIAIYVMLAVVIAMLGAVIFVLLKLLKSINESSNNFYMPTRQANDGYYGQPYQETYQEQYPQQSGGVVFCKQCATQFDASQGYCPQCGTRR